MAYTDDAAEKFADPKRTADGQSRAHVGYRATETLWFNTGTLCNIECAGCYIESSPTNDRLVYLTLADVLPYLDELDAAGEAKIEIGITGGEPFMAPDILEIVRVSLDRGHSVLLLTNAMQPMQRPRIKNGLLALKADYGNALTLRVSVDHYSARRHDEERGVGAFDIMCFGLEWLAKHGFDISLAGRTFSDESDADLKAGYEALCQALGFELDVNDVRRLVLFPEMEADANPPEITTDCWGILSKDPNELMCASQRMVVRRKGADRASVLACTLIPYDERFEMGHTLKEARGAVSLNHPYCASFCVLGGGSCSA